MSGNADTPAPGNGSPDQPSPPAGAWMGTAPVPPCYFVAVEHSFGGPTRYEAEAPMPEEARELLRVIEADRTAKAEDLKAELASVKAEAGMMRDAAGGEAHARIIAEEKWRKKHAALRAVLAILVTEITALPQCFSCKAHAGHFNDCPVYKARELLEGENSEKGATDGK